jgi:hypothetical protein
MDWGKSVAAKISFFFMNMSRKKLNAHVYYSPGVDRCFAVDTFDPYTSMEIAQILSSKMPAILILVLHRDEILEVNNGNATNYTIMDKSPIQGNALLYNRHSPSIRKMQKPVLVECANWPDDYNDNDHQDIFLHFSQYAQFVIRCWHAAKLSELFTNTLPLSQYNEVIGHMVPENFSVPSDSNTSGISITQEIRKILYTSNHIEEALDAIEELWRQNNTPMTIFWRRMFYN